MISTTSLLFLFCLLTLTTSLSNYEVTKQDTDTSSITLTIKYTGSENYYIRSSSPIMKELIVYLQVLNYYDFRLKIYDPSNSRF